MLKAPARRSQEVLKRTSLASLSRIKENKACFYPFLVEIESKSIQNVLTSKPSQRIFLPRAVGRTYWLSVLMLLVVTVLTYVLTALNQKTLIFASNPVYSLVPFVVKASLACAAVSMHVTVPPHPAIHMPSVLFPRGRPTCMLFIHFSRPFKCQRALHAIHDSRVATRPPPVVKMKRKCQGFFTTGIFLSAKRWLQQGNLVISASSLWWRNPTAGHLNNTSLRGHLGRSTTSCELSNLDLWWMLSWLRAGEV